MLFLKKGFFFLYGEILIEVAFGICRYVVTCVKLYYIILKKMEYQRLKKFGLFNANIANFCHF